MSRVSWEISILGAATLPFAAGAPGFAGWAWGAGEAEAAGYDSAG